MDETGGYAVIIPTRDRAGLLARALDSVAAQTLLPAEVIVVDNSPQPAAIDDRGLTMLGVRFEVVRAPHAPNAAAVRNGGLRHTPARYVAFLDDDDEWLPGKMQAQLAFLRLHPHCSAVVCGRQVVSPRTRHAEIPTKAQLAALLPYDNFGGSFSFITYDRARCAGLALDEGLGAFQDWDFLLQAARCGAIGTVPEVLAVYHDHEAPRITRKIAGRRQALRRLHLTHRPHLDRDARRWMIARQWDLRAQEFKAGGQWWPAGRSVGRSLRWGWRCRLPAVLKFRSFGRRLALLLPAGLAARVGTLARGLKARSRPLPLQDLSA